MAQTLENGILFFEELDGKLIPQSYYGVRMSTLQFLKKQIDVPDDPKILCKNPLLTEILFLFCVFIYSAFSTSISCTVNK